MINRKVYFLSLSHMVCYMYFFDSPFCISKLFATFGKFSNSNLQNSGCDWLITSTQEQCLGLAGNSGEKSMMGSDPHDKAVHDNQLNYLNDDSGNMKGATSGRQSFLSSVVVFTPSVKHFQVLFTVQKGVKTVTFYIYSIFYAFQGKFLCNFAKKTYQI